MAHIGHDNVLSRRQFVAGASSLGTLAALQLAGCGKPNTSQPSGALAPGMTLRSAGETSGILAGCAVNMEMLRSQPEYAALIGHQLNLLVAENAMKFQALRPSPTTFDFRDADYLMDFAKSHHQKVRGHNFVWHNALPGWFAKYVTPDNAEQVLVDHIQRVGGRYAGRMHSWDVVNEAIDPKDKLPGGLRDTPWYKLLGPKYIDIAYHAARKADPHALLVYNDYGIEEDNEASAKKRTAVLELLRGMQHRGVPIDALGIQSHIYSGSHTVYGVGLTGLIEDVERMGLKVLITELDVNDRGLPAAFEQRDEAVAKTYEQYLKLVLSQKSVIAVLTWGITDKATWLDDKDYARKDGLPQRPLPFDPDLKPTAAYFAEYNALRNAPKR